MTGATWERLAWAGLGLAVLAILVTMVTLIGRAP